MASIQYKHQDGAIPEEIGERPSVYAEFYIHSMVDQPASDAAGKLVYRDMEWCRMSRIGSNGTTTEDAVNRLRRNPQLWPYLEPIYHAWKRGEEEPVSGTRIDMAPFITPSMVSTLKQLNIRSVEDLAELPDSMLGALGMGAQAMREKAKNWLLSANDAGKVVGKISTLESENASLKSALDELKARLDAIAKDKAEQKPVTNFRK